MRNLLLFIKAAYMPESDEYSLKGCETLFINENKSRTRCTLPMNKAIIRYLIKYRIQISISERNIIYNNNIFSLEKFHSIKTCNENNKVINQH